MIAIMGIATPRVIYAQGVNLHNFYGTVDSYSGEEAVIVHAYATGVSGVWAKDDNNLQSGWYNLTGQVGDGGAAAGSTVIFRYTDTNNADVQAKLASLTGTIEAGGSDGVNLTALELSSAVSAPSNLQATPGSPDANQVTLTWNADSDPDISGYYVFRSVENAKHFELYSDLLSSDTTTYVDNNATSGTTYYYQVRARDDDGTAAPGYRDGPPSTILTADSSLPVCLSAFTAIYDYDGCTLEWTTQTEVNNLGFHIYRSTTKDGEYIRVNKKIIEGAGNSAMSRTYKYIDESVDSNVETYFYYLEDVDVAGVKNRFQIIEVTKVSQPIPKKFALLQNYPNPCNPETWMPFMLPEDATVTFKIYDAAGHVVRTLYLGKRMAGMFLDKSSAAYWDGKNETGERIVSGIYFYAIKAGKFVSVKKMVLLK